MPPQMTGDCFLPKAGEVDVIPRLGEFGSFAS